MVVKTKALQHPYIVYNCLYNLLGVGLGVCGNRGNRVYPGQVISGKATCKLVHFFLKCMTFATLQPTTLLWHCNGPKTETFGNAAGVAFLVWMGRNFWKQ